MGQFRVNGVDSLDLTFERKAQLSDDDLFRIIRAGAEVMRDRLREKVQTVFRQHSGDLANSFKLFPRKDNGQPVIYVRPSGSHSPNGRGIRNRRKYLKKQKKTNKEQKKTSAEVAYVLEYGSPRHTATHFMEICAEESAPEVTAAMEAEFNRLLDERGL